MVERITTLLGELSGSNPTQSFAIFWDGNGRFTVKAIGIFLLKQLIFFSLMSRHVFEFCIHGTLMQEEKGKKTQRLSYIKILNLTVYFAIHLISINEILVKS